MKVLQVIPSVGPQRGGPSFAVRAIAKGLTQRHIETHIATTDDNGPSRLAVPLECPVEEEGVIYWYFPRQTSFYQCSFPFAAWLWRHAEEYQLIHIHTVFSYCSNVAAWIARRKGIPYIVRPLGVLNRWGIRNRRPALKRLSFALVEKTLLRDAARVHYTAEQERLEAAELNFAHRPIVIPNPVEIPAYSQEDLQGQFRARYTDLKDRPIVLFLSRIDRKKGLDLLLPAFREIRQKYRDAVLVIAGTGVSALVDDLHIQSRDLGIDDAVFWLGFLDGTAKFAALADADIFVLPSYSENFGIAVVEAMSMRIPVIVTDQVGIHHEISEHHAGLVIRPIARELIHALERLLSEPELRSTLGRNGAALARSHFAADIVMDKLIGTYRDVLRAEQVAA